MHMEALRSFLCSKRVTNITNNLINCSFCHNSYNRCNKCLASSAVSNNNWYCNSCLINNVSFCSLNESDFNNVLNEFKYGPSKVKSHLPVEEMPFNPFSLNDKYTEEINNLDPTISMPRIEDKYFLHNEFNQQIKSNNMSQLLLTPCKCKKPPKTFRYIPSYERLTRN